MPEPQKQRDDRAVLDDVFSLVYEELRRLASFVRKNEANSTVNSTALVHEAWLKLRNSPRVAATSGPHFKAIAAKAMRQVLVDEARRRIAHKRGGAGDVILVAFGDAGESTASCDEELLTLDAALEELKALNARQAQMIECRFFGGLSIGETAALLGTSDSAMERDWRAARAWLASKVRPTT